MAPPTGTFTGCLDCARHDRRGETALDGAGFSQRFIGTMFVDCL
jgi:hypothetical protein